MRFPRGLSLDGVQETDDVGVGRKKLVPRSDRLETKEQKIPDDVLVVVVELVEASHDVADAQLLLGVLQEVDESLLAAVGQLGAGDEHVQALLPQHAGPRGAHPAQASSGETYLNCSVLGEVALLAAQIRSCRSIALGVRGISFVPRASALWEFPTCAGGIKPAAEAHRPEKHPASSWRSLRC